MIKHEFAVILLDVEMPVMDGFATAALIRERKRSEHTPIIFVTPQYDDSLVSRGYSLGAVDFISTPIDPDVLRTKVGVFVDLYQKAETIRQQAAHRVQLAREQAARQVAEKAMRRSALLAEASRLLSRSLTADDCSWVAGVAPTEARAAKTRYRQADADCRFSTVDGTGFALVFEQPQWAVTPGQSAVLYDGDVCLGGGVISAHGVELTATR